jgi:hypothetical protein
MRIIGDSNNQIPNKFPCLPAGRNYQMSNDRNAFLNLGDWNFGHYLIIGACPAPYYVQGKEFGYYLCEGPPFGVRRCGSTHKILM